MIKFFRRMRQKLLAENKFSRYLLYAIGEILLVVIGILIALQLNVNREKNEAREIEVVYLQNILSDLNQEVIDLEKMIIIRTNKSKAADTIISFIDGKNENKLESLNKNQATVFMWRVHQPNDDSFSELMNSGQLSMIKSNEIRKTLLKLSSLYSILSEVEEHLKFEYHEFLYKKNISSIDYILMFDSRNKKTLTSTDSILLNKNMAVIRNDMALKNTYVLASINNNAMTEICAELLLKVKQTIKLIEKDLDKD